MSESEPGGHPIQMALIVLLLSGGAWYFFRHYDIDGLDGVSIGPKQREPFPDIDSGPDFTFTSSTDAGRIGPEASLGERDPAEEGDRSIFSPSDLLTFRGSRSPASKQASPTPNLKVASWALEGFGMTKLASDVARRNLVRVIRQFDVIAVQQIPAHRRDVVPRMVEAINEGAIDAGGPIYDYVLGPPVGPPVESRAEGTVGAATEQLAILFNPRRVRVDRTQTYTVADPDEQMTYDPLVAWFRAVGPTEREAWTFTVVNVRIDLARAPAEVALLGGLFEAVQKDGRGEDDVLMAGLFQADDEYLMPVVAGPSMRAVVRSTPTDVFGRHQTCNLLFDAGATVEAVGAGGAYDFLRVYNLSLDQAQTVSSYLPVFAEFSAREGTPVAESPHDLSGLPRDHPL